MVLGHKNPDSDRSLHRSDQVSGCNNGAELALRLSESGSVPHSADGKEQEGDEPISLWVSIESRQYNYPISNPSVQRYHLSVILAGAVLWEE